MRYLPLLLFFFTACAAQPKTPQNGSFSGEKAEVYQVIIDLFDGMREGDSSKVHRTFDDRVTMWTSFKNKEGVAVLTQGDLQTFLNAIGTPHEEVWDEKIRNTKIEIKDNLAQAWTEYGFFIGEKFSHCGVDAFLFSKIDGRWQIINLADTRQRAGCDWEE